MKILHFIEGRCNPDTANGVDKTIFYLTRELAQLGHEIHLVSETKKDLIEIPGVHLHRVDPFRNCFRLPEKVRALVDGIEPDFGHFHSAYVPGNISLSRYLRKKEIPYAVTPNGNCARVLLKRKPWLKLPYKHLLERPYMNKAAFVHSVGDTTEIVHYGVTTRVVEALNGIDPKTVPKEADRSCIENLVPKFKGRFVCVFVGRLDIEQKGLDVLIPAVARLGESAREVGILLVGPEWKGSLAKIQNMIEENGVADSFHLFGPAYGSEKFDLMIAADGFIYPSRWEGLPFAVVEAMAVGQLCLVTPASDPAGLLGDRGAGVVFDATQEGIREGIVRAKSLDQNKRAELLASSAEIVREKMTWDVIAKTVEEAYLKALESK